jgi:hypothetical protein
VAMRTYPHMNVCFHMDVLSRTLRGRHRPWTCPRPPLLIVCLALLVVLATATSASAENPTTAPVITTPHSTTASPTTHFRHESVKEFEKQLIAGQVAAATFNKKAHTLHLALKDGKHMLVRYPSHEEPKLAAELRVKGPSAQTAENQRTASKAKAADHTLRYIAGGIVAILVGILVAALLVKRRRQYQGAPAPSGDAG